MPNFTSWFTSLVDMLRYDGVEACLLMLEGGRRRFDRVIVPLVLDDCTVPEALTTSRMLMDMGQEEEGIGILRDVIAACLGEPRRALVSEG